MASRAICVALLLSSLPIAGCGTVANVVSSHPEEGVKDPFGGVRQDLCCIKKAANGEFGARIPPKSDSEQYPHVALMLLCAADLPFSFVGDVLMWPFTATYSFINQPSPVPPVVFTNQPLGPPVPGQLGPQPLPLPAPLSTQPMRSPVPSATQPPPIQIPSVPQPQPNTPPPVTLPIPFLPPPVAPTAATERP